MAILTKPYRVDCGDYITGGGNSGTITFKCNADGYACWDPGMIESNLEWLDRRVQEMRVKL